MMLEPATTPYCWYMHPPALVRWRDLEYRDSCILCIGPTAYQFASPEWSAIAPVVTPLPYTGTGVNFALLAEGHRIAKQFNLEKFNKFKLDIKVPV